MSSFKMKSSASKLVVSCKHSSSFYDVSSCNKEGKSCVVAQSILVVKIVLVNLDPSRSFGFTIKKGGSDGSLTT